MVDKIRKSGEIFPISQKNEAIKALKPRNAETLPDRQVDQIISGTTAPEKNIGTHSEGKQILSEKEYRIPELDEYIIAHGVNPNKSFADLGLNSPASLIDTEGFNTI